MVIPEPCTERWKWLAMCLFVPLLAACSHAPVTRSDLAALQPLHYQNTTYSPQAALQEAGSTDLLALTPEMKQFADRYIRVGNNDLMRLRLLHRSLRSSGMVGIEYDPHADGTAAQAFESGQANCLSYAHLFVALARYLGLRVRFQSLSLRPEWSRHGDRVALRQHVNVVVILRGNEKYMVDIDPVQRARVTKVEELTDEQAHALHDNNLAMTLLLRGELAGAWSHAVQALGQSPDTDYLWVNLGAIYRMAGQDAAAEQSYYTALHINPNSNPAMNNLMVLYDNRGEIEKAQLWEERVESHRKRNPYYYAHLAEVAWNEGHLEAALAYYMQALSRKKDDADLYFRVGKLYMSMNQPENGVRYVELAIKHARLVGEREAYEAYLDGINRDALAALDQVGRTRM